MKFIKAEKAVTKVTCEFTLDELHHIRRTLLTQRQPDWDSEETNRKLVCDLGTTIEQARRA